MGDSAQAETQQESEQTVERWTREFAAAEKEVEKWRKRGKRIVKRFRDERERGQTEDTRWNFFSSNVQTQRAMLYGQTPKVDVTRRFGDASDDVARVAATILERVLNCDIEAVTDTYAQTLGQALDDRLLPGLGFARIRYEREEAEVEAQEAVVDDEGAELAPAVEAYTELKSENVVVDYVPWSSHLWSPAPVFQEVRWWAFEAQMSRKALIKRFGDIGAKVPLKTPDGKDDRPESPWGRAQVWEIWDKESRQVVFFVKGFDRLLEVKDDPLQLKGFWPFPRPMAANLTTDSLVPTPDFALAQDVYNEIDNVSSRITLLEKAIAVRGVYAADNKGIQRILGDAVANELIPIENFAAFMEKGGIAGAIAWMPLDQVVLALDKLREYRAELVSALWQLTGMSDIMRGQRTSGAETTATEERLKAQFGSVRMQALQDEFARFASDLQSLKTEVMARFFDPQTLLERSNIMATPDAAMAQQAIELIKSEWGLYRVEVKPENVSMADFASQRSEATEFVQGLATFLTAAQPVAAAVPGATTMLLELLQLVMTRFKFAGEAEGIIDRAIGQVKAQQGAANPQATQVDPKVQAAQLKAVTDLQKVQLEHQADMARIGAETQAEVLKQRAQAIFNSQEEAARSAIKLREAHQMPRRPVVTPGVKP